MAENVELWMCEELGKLGIDASEDNAKYILGIETAEELEEYMLELLDGSDQKTKAFIKELLIKWRPYYNSVVPQNFQEVKKLSCIEIKAWKAMNRSTNCGTLCCEYSFELSPQDDSNEYLQHWVYGSIGEILKSKYKVRRLSVALFRIYMKPKEEEAYFVGKEKKKSSKQEKKSTSNSIQNGFDNSAKNVLPVEEKTLITEKEVKKKQKFVPLYSKEGRSKDVIQLQGRHACECQAAKHKLVGNCTRCGRVVCEQEGSGPCLFCGKLVCTKEEEELISKGTKRAEKLRNSLMKNGPDRLLNESLFNGDRSYLPNTNHQMKDGFEKAERHKEKLLEFDRTSVRRTQVIDDESDYFSTDNNQWLSKTDREALRKREEELRSQKYASRKDRKITLDFAGRRVIEEDPNKTVNMYDVNDEIVQQVHYGARPKVKDTIGIKENMVNSDSDSIVNPTISTEAPKFIGTKVSGRRKDQSSSDSEKRPISRLQDRELQEMSDEGMCMSMHQPWASLLVCGIKKHEGRTWYTAHRGRLWIAATAKPPDPAEIADVEQTYKYILKNPNLDFPSSYPVGCLLGCVDVTDCVAHEDYQEKYPDGESGSPFVFICENPQQLVVKFPVKGKHKIYKLETHIHKAAKKGLR